MFLRIYINKIPSKSIDFQGFYSINDMILKNPAKRAGPRLENPTPDLNDQLAIQQPIHIFSDDSSEIQDTGYQTPPETNPPGLEIIIKGKGAIQQQPEGSSSRQPLASENNNNINDNNDDYHYD